MEHRSNYVAMQDAQIKLRTEDCALGMGHMSNTNDAATKDVQTMLKKEESAFNMGQRETCATVKDAQTKYSVEECA